MLVRPKAVPNTSPRKMANGVRLLLLLWIRCKGSSWNGTKLRREMGVLQGEVALSPSLDEASLPRNLPASRATASAPPHSEIFLY